MGNLYLRYFNEAQIREMVRDVHKKWGEMWNLCGPKVRTAFIEQHVVEVLLASLTSPTIDKAAVQELRFAMLVEAGLADSNDARV